MSDLAPAHLALFSIARGMTGPKFPKYVFSEIFLPCLALILPKEAYLLFSTAYVLFLVLSIEEEKREMRNLRVCYLGHHLEKKVPNFTYNFS